MTKTEQPWIRAQFLRVGTQLKTGDGWQTIRGLVIFEDADQVTAFTDQRDDEKTNGWRYRFNELVQWRAAAADTGCPPWCVEHYDGGEQQRDRNHSSFPQAVTVVEVHTGQPRELGMWLERRDYQEAGGSETVGLLEVGLIAEDVELTPDQMRRLARKLKRLADQAEGK